MPVPELRTKPSTPAAVAETPGLWDRFRTFFSGEAAVEVPETKKPSLAEKLFCNQLGVTMACSDESIQEGLALHFSHCSIVQ